MIEPVLGPSALEPCLGLRDAIRLGVPANQIHPVDAQEVHEDRRIRHDHCRRRRSHETGHSVPVADDRSSHGIRRLVRSWTESGVALTAPPAQ